MKLLFTIYLLFSTLLFANAQIFVKHDATGTNDGTSWTNAFTDLQDALDATIPGNQVWLAAGTYIPDGPTPDSSHFLMLTPVEIYGGFVGTESSLSERDWRQNLTILSGDINDDDVPGDFQNLRTDNAHHVLIINAPIGETTVDGLLFQGGMTRVDAFAPDAMDVPYHRWRGGGLYIYKSTCTIRNCTFRDNYGTQGTGMFATGYTAESRKLILENSLFELNEGVIAGACWIAGWENAIIRECVFQQNYAGSNSGAMALGNCHAIIEDCSFDQNSTSGVGGSCLIFNNSFSLIPHPTYHFSRSEFTGNSAPSGGAIQLNNFISSFGLTFDSCSFSQNRATSSFGSGGAFYVNDKSDDQMNELISTVSISRSMFTSNSSTYGGAIEIDCEDDSLRIEVSQSGFFNNSASDSGGGLYVWMVETSNVYTQIENSDFSGNTARVGGGLILDSYYNIDRMTYLIERCNFSNNVASLYGGAIGQFLTQGPGLIGSIRNTQFLNNQALQAGALISRQETLLVENCLFSGNYAEGYESDSTGGGAIIFTGPAAINVRNSIFETNRSDVEGSAVFSAPGVNGKYENVLFDGNMGSSTLANRGSLEFMNITMVGNDSGLFLGDMSSTVIQNSIFDNGQPNLRTENAPDIISNGGNISSDGSMSGVLTGSGGYGDFNNTNPLLGPDFVPLAGSPAIDAGNPTGNTSLFDLAGNPRVQGSSIDIGSFETFTVATENAIWNTQSLTVFPNPVKESLNFQLESDWTGKFKLLMYNYAGQQILQTDLFKNGSTQTFQLNINHQLPGEYVLIVKAGSATYASNIIITR